MVRVCHITSAHKRYDVRIFEKECVSLAQSGYDTYLIVNDDLKDEQVNGVHIVSTMFLPKSRYERMFKSMSILFDKALEIDAEVYHLHDPELLQIAVKLKKYGKKVIFDAHEDTEKQILDKTYIPKAIRKIVAGIYALYSTRKIKKLDGVVTVTPVFVEKFKKINPNTILVTNYPIVKESKDLERQVPKKNEEKYVFFAGGISEQWCHDVIADAVIKVGNVKYMLAGDGSKVYIDSLLKKGNQIEYIGRLPHEKVMEQYKNAIAGMAVLKCSQTGEEGTLGNTKLFEVMQAGKPVICSNLRLWREIVEGFHCGICVDSQDVSSIADAIQYILVHPEQAAVMGENGRKAILEKYNWKLEERKLLEAYGNLVPEI